SAWVSVRDSVRDRQRRTRVARPTTGHNRPQPATYLPTAYACAVSVVSVGAAGAAGAAAASASFCSHFGKYFFRNAVTCSDGLAPTDIQYLMRDGIRVTRSSVFLTCGS